MAFPSLADANKKLTLTEITTSVSSKYPEIFAHERDRVLFENDFKLLVRTFVMDGSFVRLSSHVTLPSLAQVMLSPIQPGFEQVKKRRFHDVLNHEQVKAFDVRAKQAGDKTTLLLAKQHSVGVDIAEMNREAVSEIKGICPHDNEKIVKESLAKLLADLS